MIEYATACLWKVTIVGNVLRSERGSFIIKDATEEECRARGFGPQFVTKDKKYVVWANGTQAFATVNR